MTVFREMQVTMIKLNNLYNTCKGRGSSDKVLDSIRDHRRNLDRSSKKLALVLYDQGTAKQEAKRNMDKVITSSNRLVDDVVNSIRLGGFVYSIYNLETYLLKMSDGSTIKRPSLMTGTITTILKEAISSLPMNSFNSPRNDISEVVKELLDNILDIFFICEGLGKITRLSAQERYVTTIKSTIEKLQPFKSL